MCESDNEGRLVPYEGLTRRNFAALTAAAGAAGIGGAAHAQAAEVTEKAVNVRTPDGTADAYLYYPAGGGRHPGVLIWPDIMGLRPAFQDMGKRLASSGYVVLVVNPFYRSVKGNPGVDFGSPEGRQTLFGYRQAISDAGAAADGKAYVAFLDRQPQTSNAKVGVQGYCMGGALSMMTAAAAPTRIGAVGSFHGGNGLVTDMPNSPHLLIAKTNARYLFATAKNDDDSMPNVKARLRDALREADRPGVVDVYQANHGWCVPDGAVYNQAEAERAWDNLLKMYKVSLV